MTCPHSPGFINLPSFILLVNLDVFPSSCKINPSSDQYCSLSIYLLICHFQKKKRNNKRGFPPPPATVHIQSPKATSRALITWVQVIRAMATCASFCYMQGGNLFWLNLKWSWKKKKISALWYRKQFMVLQKSEEYIECISPLTVTDTIICTKASLWLSGASATIISIPGWQIKQHLGQGNECSAEINAWRKSTPGGQKDWLRHSPSSC